MRKQTNQEKKPKLKRKRTRKNDKRIHAGKKRIMYENHKID